MERILIVEDEESILMALEDNLKIEGYNITSAVDGEEGFVKAKENSYDLILLDIMLPKLDGFEVCKKIRAEGIDTPIIMLTAKSQEIDKVLGLELGADDYVTKPFSSRELLARIKAILRRTKLPKQDIDKYNFGNIEVNFNNYEVRKSGKLIYLTALEFNLLHFLIDNKNQVIERDKILDEVWGDNVYVQARTVDKHISELRKKIEDDPPNPVFIIGVRSIGYKFIPGV